MYGALGLCICCNVKQMSCSLAAECALGEGEGWRWAAADPASCCAWSRRRSSAESRRHQPLRRPQMSGVLQAALQWRIALATKCCLQTP